MGLVSRREAARFLGVHVTTLDKLLGTTNGPATVRMGRRVLVSRSGLESWVKQEAV